MNISKIGANSFKGYLEIQNKNRLFCFVPKDIKKVTKIRKGQETLIAGKEIGGDYMQIYIPNSSASYKEIIKAYKTARDMENVISRLNVDEISSLTIYNIN